MSSNLHFQRKANSKLHKINLLKVSEKELEEISTEFALGLNLKEIIHIKMGS